MHNISVIDFAMAHVFWEVSIVLLLAHHLQITLCGQVRAGGPCQLDDQCYSAQCFQGLCASDSAIKGKVGTAGHCTTSEDCFSGHCTSHQWCANDSPIPGLIGGGGPCASDNECYSGRCWRQECAADGPVRGKVGDGGKCASDDDCYSEKCIDGFCGESKKPQVGDRQLGEACGNDADCRSRICVMHKCAARRRSINESCLIDSDCLLGVCPRGICIREAHQPAVVIRKSANGQACAEHAECDYRLCVYEVCVDSSRAAMGYGGTVWIIEIVLMVGLSV